MDTPLTYSSVLSIVRRWPPAQRLHFLQEVMKTLRAVDVHDAEDEPSPAQIANDVRTALREYSTGQVYEIRDTADLARLIKESGDDLASAADIDA